MAKNGLHLITPTSIAYTGTSASISANGSVTFSAVSPLSLNGVFSADYDNYMVVVRGASGTPWPYSHIRMRASGTDNSTSNSYTSQLLYGSATSVTGSRSTGINTFDAFIGTSESGSVIHFYGPHLAQPTALRSVTTIASSGTSSTVLYDVASTHNQSVSYDGFSMIADSSHTFTGRIAVYGMRK